jgi:hypothetical protein
LSLFLGFVSIATAVASSRLAYSLSSAIRTATLVPVGSPTVGLGIFIEYLLSFTNLHSLDQIMRSSRALVWVLGAVVSATSSTKRGLVFVPNSNYPQDNKVWTKTGSDLTWYYNYGSSPSPAYAAYSQDEFEFVPMIWGNVAGTEWLDEVNVVIRSGRKISHVLGFNEPDGDMSTGGSALDPSVAAQVWVKNVEPLAAQGIKLGMPACTGGWGGLPWLTQFVGNCSNLVSTSTVTKNCTFDFLPMHWYGNFAGLASHMGEYAAA